MSPARPLTEREATLLEKLVAVQPNELRSIYEAQARTARVKSRCSCGCPTINFDVDTSRARAGDDPRWEIANVESPLGPVMLVVNEGWLESLELVYWVGDTPPSEFPDPETLVPRVRLEP